MTDRPEAETCLRVRISGQVQGVWFRASLRDEAQRHGGVGWVRNCPDGSVEAEIHASPPAMEAILHWCQRGPSMAMVHQVAITPCSGVGQRPTSFIILRDD